MLAYCTLCLLKKYCVKKYYAMPNFLNGSVLSHDLISLIQGVKVYAD